MNCFQCWEFLSFFDCKEVVFLHLKHEHNPDTVDFLDWVEMHLYVHKQIVWFSFIVVYRVHSLCWMFLCHNMNKHLLHIFWMVPMQWCSRHLEIYDVLNCWHLFLQVICHDFLVFSFLLYSIFKLFFLSTFLRLWYGAFPGQRFALQNGLG